MQCVMHCMIVHEWNVSAFKLFFLNLFHSFFIFPRLNECEMQMSYANAMIGLTNALCNHCAPICYWQTLGYWPKCQFSMNANKTWCKSRFFFISDTNVISMMPMSHVGIETQGLFMRMPVHVFRTWCRCLLVEMEMQMSSNGYVMMQMSFYRNAMMQMLWRKHNLFKNSLCFEIKTSLAPKIFSNLDLLFPEKSSFFLTYGSQKKLVITVRNLRMGDRLGIWWFGSKDLFSQFGWAKGVTHF